MKTEERIFSGVRAVVFDKDGTLIDFDAFWVSVSERAIDVIFEKLGVTDGAKIKEEILSAFGVTDGVIDIDGVLCKGTYLQMSDIVYNILTNHGFSTDADALYKLLLDSYEKSTEHGTVLPTCEGLKDTLEWLRAQGASLFVVTTDNYPITKKCLIKLGIFELFDRIYCDDGVMPTKPNPAAINDICKCCNFEKSEIVMVGDTMTDILFAKAGGAFAISVSKNEKNRARLAPKADLVISEISDLVRHIER